MNLALAQTPCADEVRAMTPTERDLLLLQMRVAVEPPSVVYLQTLQWAFLKTSPFHNLEMLAGMSPRTVEACIEAVTSGRGGPCHVQATALLALLRSLDFDAHLAAATITQPGDHLVVVVRLAEGSFVCDVGNGQPFLKPFALVGQTVSEHLGWHFVSHGSVTRLTLSRQLDNGTWKHVYSADPSPRTFADFRGIIDGHHEKPGFGPFLDGLRAVLLRDDLVVTLRDNQLRRYSIAGVHDRSVADGRAAARVLRRVFGLTQAPIEPAISVLRHRMQAWQTAAAIQPSIAVSLSTTGRPDNLTALLSGLGAEWLTYDGGSSPLLVVVVDNSAIAEDRAENLRHAATFGQRGVLDLQWVDDGIYGRSIAESRRRQVAALAKVRAQGRGVDIVWMLDDDVELAQLQVCGGRLSKTSEIRYFEQIVRLYRDHPEASVLVGGVCGDPPIRPDAVLATQLFDLEANLERFASLCPDDRYLAHSQRTSFALPDYYYDHSRAGVLHLATPFVWLARGETSTVRDEALAFMGAMTGGFWGKTPTRPLVYDASKGTGELSDCILRGGNTVFLDVDALFRHAYPSTYVGGFATRRSDMVGAALLSQDGGTWFAQFPYPILHDRKRAHRPLDEEAQREQVLRSIRSEFYGVLLARDVIDGNSQSFLAIATVRAEVILERLADAQVRAHRALLAIARARTTWLGADPEMALALETLERHVAAARQIFLGGTSEPDAKAWLQRIEGILLDIDSFAQIEQFAREDLSQQLAENAASVAAILNGGRHDAQ